MERELAEYFAGSRRIFEVPLELVGTPFQKSVWKVLLGIEYGDRISYLEQSRRVGGQDALVHLRGRLQEKSAVSRGIAVVFEKRRCV